MKIRSVHLRAPVVHVLDASRAVGVVSKLLSDQRDSYAADVKADLAKIRERRLAARASKNRVPIAQARQKAWIATGPPIHRPSRTSWGSRTCGLSLEDLIDYIDWTPFFFTWEMKGSYPAIFDDPNRGEAAKSLFEDAPAMLERIVAEKWLEPRAVFGFWPANRVGDDAVLYTDESRKEVLETFYGLRQQRAKSNDNPHLNQFDFLAPEGTPDWLAGSPSRPVTILISWPGSRPTRDDYNSILFKALSDRLAEAAANGCTKRCAANTGAMRRRRPSPIAS